LENNGGRRAWWRGGRSTRSFKERGRLIPWFVTEIRGCSGQKWGGKWENGRKISMGANKRSKTVISQSRTGSDVKGV